MLTLKLDDSDERNLAKIKLLERIRKMAKFSAYGLHFKFCVSLLRVYSCGMVCSVSTADRRRPDAADTVFCFAWGRDEQASFLCSIYLLYAG